MSRRFFSRRTSSKVSNQFQSRAIYAAVEALEPRQLLSYGSLDPTYGSAGTTALGAFGPISASAQSMVEQPDGKFIVGTTIDGDFALQRFNSNGSLDTSFGSNGEVRTSFGAPEGGNLGLLGIALAPDGKIVAVGEEIGLAAVAQYNPDGSLDTTFNGTGELTFDFTSGDISNLTLVTVDSDDRIIVAGYDTNSNTNITTYDVARITPTGDLDAAFDSNVAQPLGFKPTAITTNSANQIVIVGILNNADIAVDWLNQDGSQNTAFGGDGLVDDLQFANGYYTASAVAIDAEDRVVIAGTDFNSYGDEVVGVIRLNSDGSLDNTFNGDGQEDIDFGNYSNAQGQSIAIETSGTIVIGGQVSDSSGYYDFAVVELNGDGSLDASFNPTGPLPGTQSISLGAGINATYASVAVDSSGDVLIAATAESSSFAPIFDEQFGFAEVTSTGAADDSLNGTGTEDTLYQGIQDAGTIATTLETSGDTLVAFATDQGLDSYLVQLNPDGSVDTSFGVDGTVHVTTPNFTITSVTAAPDGTIYLGGNQGSEGDEPTGFVVYSFTSAGAVNPAFNSGSPQTVTFFPGDITALHGIALDAGGNIVLAGETYNPSFIPEVAVARLLPDGNLDPSFGSGGEVLTNLGGSSSSGAGAVAINTTGEIVLAGERSGDLAVAMLFGDGTADTNFGAHGYSVLSAVPGAAQAVALDASGDIITSGSSGSDFLVTEFSSAGALNTAFNDNLGYYQSDFSGEAASEAVALDAAGDIFSVGFDNATNGNTYGAIVALNPDGTVNSAFGSGGTVLALTDSTFQTLFTSAAVDSFGRLLVGGGSDVNGVGTEAIVSRYTNGPLAAAVSVSPVSVTYGDSATLTANVSSADTVNTGSVTFTVTDSLDNVVDSATVPVSGGSAQTSVTLPAGTYNVAAAYSDSSDTFGAASGAGTLTVTQAALSVAVNDVTVPYGTAAVAFGVTYTGFITGEGPANLSGSLDFSTLATPTSAVGNYAVWVSGVSSPNYDITFVPGTLTIAQAALTVTVQDTTSVYGSSLPAFGVSYAGFENSEGPSVLGGALVFSTSASSSSPVGNYTVSASGLTATNYVIAYQSGDINITPAALSVSVNNATSVYGAALPAFGVSYSGFVNSDSSSSLSGSLVFSTSASSASGVGNYDVSASGLSSANYDISYQDGTLAITPAALSVTVNNASRNVGAANPTFSGVVSGLVNGDTVNVTYSTTATVSSPAGGYPINATVTGSALVNYNLTVLPGTLVVNAVVSSQTLSVIVNNATRAYGAANPTFSGTVSGAVNGDTFTVIYSTTATSAGNVGTYPITATVTGSDLSNYTLVVTPGTLTITKASLTVAANPQSKVYGQANPTLTGTITGLVNGDNITATYSTTATTSSGVGSYPITPTVVDHSGHLSDYNLTVTASTLTVTKAALTITAQNQTKVYGSANPALTVTYSGFVNGDSPASLTHAPTVTTTATTSSNVGSYPITASGATAANYSITYAAGTLTITPATLYVIVDSTIKFVGQSDPTFATTDIGFVLSQNASVLGGTLVFTTTAGKNSPIGIYIVDASGLTSTNYDIVYIPGILIEL